MSEDINRENILGTAAKSYSFDKVLRGYEPKQVDDYIASLINSNKNTSEILNARLGEIKNDNDMLSFELQQARDELKDALSAIAKMREDMANLSAQNTKANAAAAAAAAAASKNEHLEELSQLQDKNARLTAKNKLLSEENKKLEDKNRDMQRDIAHLTKKVDKNRNKIGELTTQLETGGAAGAGALEIAQIYESAIDKAEDLIFRLQNEFSLAHSKAEDAKNKEAEAAPQEG